MIAKARVLEQHIPEPIARIGAADIPQILIWNKIDVNGLEPGLERDEYGKIYRVRLSAATGDGVELLRLALSEAASASAGARRQKPTQELEL